jgi:alpha-tubulin suppressor-like RCC1 family protein
MLKTKRLKVRLFVLLTVIIITGYGGLCAGTNIDSGSSKPPLPGGLIKPIVITYPATDRTFDSATLHGMVNPNGINTMVYFQWGRDTRYHDTVINCYPIGGGKEDVPISYTPTGLSLATTYHFRLVGNTSTGIIYGKDMTFDTERPTAPPPRVTSPNPVYSATNVSVNTQLSWACVHEASFYDVYLGETANPSLMADNITKNTYTSPKLKYNTCYYWRVDSKNYLGTTKGDVWKFTTKPPPPKPGQPTLLAPADWTGHLSVPVQLSWTATANAEYYEVFLYNFYRPPGIILTTPNMTCDTGIIAYDGWYFWNVTAVNDSGRTTSPKPDWSFYTMKEPAAQVTSPNPPDGATDISIAAELSWGVATTSTSYDVYLGKDNPPPFVKNVSGTNYAPELSENTLYYWRIDSKNSEGTVTKGNVWSFTTGGRYWMELRGGSGHTIGIMSNGTLWSWGLNNYGQLGLGNTTTPITSITQVTQGITNNWQTIVASTYHSLGLMKDGTLWSWGLNNYGQLGLGLTAGSTVSRTSPTQVGSSTNWQTVAAGNYHTLGIMKDGTLWVCGKNDYGQLGLGLSASSTVSRTSPTKVGSSTNWQTVVAGNYHTLGIMKDGTLWSWGLNNYGQLGLGVATGSTVSRTSPTKVGSSTNWQTVAAGYYHTLGIRKDGTLWSWGLNNYGQLGLGLAMNSSVSYTAPTQIGTATDWGHIAVGQYHNLAMKTDFTLWSWGYNNYGQLGQGNSGTNTNLNSPTQVGTSTNWQTIAAGVYYTLCLMKDGTLWSWGYNNYGQLGLGYTNPSSVNSPTKVTYP